MKLVWMLPLAVFLLVLTVQAAPPAVTRGAFVEAMWQYAGALPGTGGEGFADVTGGGNMAEAVSWAVGLGITVGTGEGCFSPERPITREEAAILLRRCAACLGRDTVIPQGLSGCNDGEGISPWADDSLYWATGCGLIDWSPGGLLDPRGALTTEQMEAILTRFFTP